MAGVAPDIFHCGTCGIEIATNAEIPANAASCPAETCCAVYSPAEDECFCSSCRRFEAHTFPLSAEAFRYLYAVTEKAPGYSRHLPLSPAAYGELKRFLFFLTEKMTGAPLKTFQMGYV